MSAPRVIVGVGMSSRATRDEVAALVAQALAEQGFGFPPTTIATRAALSGDPRLQLGCPVVGFHDEVLVGHSGPVERSVGVAARVAETAAALAAGVAPARSGPVRRSAHATAAVAVVGGGAAEPS